ncbi:MAG: S1 RNA-binding domain-containing protein [Candidatus Cloacimonetes bacterium]|jgi:small subunit ribosomal protein S1|nr:S1 RNA-binding domain-containing protein [Candidatus Cloacimonadota bacterium]MBT6994343.1 S1 RNA-binding domain-containing protein [Candidatus Cloacimonadota bacterium]MBT7469297.1 S1 RNA-binding domain-containing protein [Candidatus Cloacimonadota bacterium]
MEKTEVKVTEEQVVTETKEMVEEKKETIENTESIDNSESFETMLEASLDSFKKFEVGEKIEGEVINITDSYIFISLGGKHDALADKSEYTNKKGELEVVVGDKLTGYIVKFSETETVVAKSLQILNVNIIQEAYADKIPVRGKVRGITKGGFLIDISGIKAFCPLSQMDAKPVVEPKQFVASTFDFRIIEFKDGGKNIVVSRRVILREEQNQVRKERLKELNIGDIVKGKVIRLTNFGAFIDLDGIDGLIHISQFSWEHIESPSEILNLGDEIESKIVKVKGNKISLSMKALQANPLDKALTELEVGQIVKCKVLRNLPFGSFVEIKVGVEGLIPISEMAHGRRINNPSEIVDEGEVVEAQILKINAEKRKISLSLKRLQPNPWDTISETIKEGEIVMGTIENVVNFGAFIKIIDGVTGLLPSAKMKIAKMNLTAANVDEQIEIRVSRIDTDARRISLEPTEMPEKIFDKRVDRGDWKKFKDEKSKEDVIKEDNPFMNL